MFDRTAFQALLTTQVLGQHVYYYPQLPSTNDKAWESAPATLPSGTLVLTDNQIAGRGRRGNTWIATPDKSLTFSIVLQPDVRSSMLGIFPLLAGVSVAQMLLEIGLTPELKWPNDVLLQGKKLAGILCESKSSGQRIRTLVIGLGLNVNETQDDFPRELQATTTSLYLQTGHTHQREKVLAALLRTLERNLEQMKTSGEGNVLDTWWKLCMHRNHEVTFHEKRHTIQGIFRGLNHQGQAILEHDGIQTTYLPDLIEIGPKD